MQNGTLNNTPINENETIFKAYWDLSGCDGLWTIFPEMPNSQLQWTRISNMFNNTPMNGIGTIANAFWNGSSSDGLWLVQPHIMLDFQFHSIMYCWIQDRTPWTGSLQEPKSYKFGTKIVNLLSWVHTNDWIETLQLLCCEPFWGALL